MGKIITLSDQIISKIAAGEVVERPAYIVKELIENAIDAQATEIIVDIYESGLGKIIITDNGVGMDREDLQLCFKRHTTSKIQHDNDLFKVTSMGFRGEALASISAISQVTIRSRTEDDQFGTEIQISCGELKKISKKGMPVGTQIIVDKIFVHVPVRIKFLQSAKFEYRQIVDILTRYVIAFPHIRFDFTHNDKRIFIVPSEGSLSERLAAFIDQEIMGSLLPFEITENDIVVSGYISKPQLNYKTPRNHYFFVNNRFVRDFRLAALIKDTYGSLLDPLAHPYLIVFISVPSHFVDVNVHPRKETVHFSRAPIIMDLIKTAIKETLGNTNLTFYDKRWNKGEATQELELHDGGTNTYAANVLKQKVTPKKQQKPLQASDIIQLHHLYLVIPSERGFILIDQHAAHERILFEEFQKTFLEEKEKAEIFTLKKPVMINISILEKELLGEKKEELAHMGFIFEERDENIWIKRVPELLKDRDINVLIRDMLDDLFANEEIRNYDNFSIAMLEYLACRAAIKAGDALTKNQMKDLINDLNKAENPYTCPHGRPIQVEMDLNYLHKLFKRK